MSGKLDPIIILVEPQLGENIGMCARAMLNCGLKELRLVNPRDGWPQDSARAAAADADLVIDNAVVYDDVETAISDCERVFATTARSRAQSTPVLDAESAVREMRQASQGLSRCAVLFGGEASGLDAESTSFADTLVRFPTNPEFSSLNLAQAVLLLGWEWRRISELPMTTDGSEPAAPREELDCFLHRLVGELDDCGFFLTEELKPHSIRSLRSLFAKARATTQEVKLLQGALTALRRRS